MFKLLDTIRSKIYFGIERLKGIRMTTRLSPKEEDVLNVKVKTIFDYKLEITVIRISYLRTYSRKYFKSKTFYSFEVVGKVSDDAPSGIKQAFNQRYYFPRMMPSYVSLEKHLERAVSDYLDMVIQRGIKDE